ncbi:RNA methyltransferase, TrmH family [Caldanaerovirga acetigignens]|uniref:RNA methyltransferase, TrmH family n=1 Tax=Caldanaerovirga acetigignens TaxID=447595 RepID=A0A1M7G708_9FIRM|nr:RNA methyltransferase [Caldanaerovirga acetigignens]SHM11868.1 RNA methyltransferase, TrmH family [Caldanaerovirga acetigignens]
MTFKELSKGQINLIKALINQKNYRKRKGLFIIEGLRATQEAINSDYAVEFIVLSDDFVKKYGGKFPGFGNVKVYKITQNLFKTLSDTKTPQGIMAVVRMKKFEIANFYEGNFLVVALDGIKDPGNMGTIIRTADAAGASGILAGKGCVDVYNPKVIRSTMGSIFHLPVVEEIDLQRVLEELSIKGAKIVVTSLGAKKSYLDADYTSPVVIVFGSEAEGVSKEILNMPSEQVKIPLFGKAESLNVAVACGILLYEAARQRRALFPL